MEDSRLDQFIRRIKAQRACLNMAAQLVAGMDGPILEFGLGNGRTYDHLRELFPGRDIYVFERDVSAHPDCIPDAAHLLRGEFKETLPDALARIGAPAVLIHGDIGSADTARDAELVAWLGPALRPLAAPGAVILSDRALGAAIWPLESLPQGVAPGVYFMYRAVALP
ncbi:MAG: hypothetical protein O3A94_09875 [Proteobacteria bacterium]|nr:hypothetical protein [Pseudomonadota bacterium]